MRRRGIAKTGAYRGNLILVNAAHPCRGTGAEDLVPVGGVPDVLLERSAAALLDKLMETFHGWQSIVPVSGWRSREEQEEIWTAALRESGEEFARTFVAAPGHSEHQTGLAIDLGLRQEVVDYICPEFPYTGPCQTFRERAAQFGFVERYPKGKEAVTGIGHEPWHFRYVGVPHAQVMAERGLCLEEYHVFLKGFRYGVDPLRTRQGGIDFTIAYLPADEAVPGLPELPEGRSRMVSGNNIDGYVVTMW